ncbi:MAG: hypothetical protein WDZ46_07850 [Solirubrobacterales bacterium]
MGIFFTIPLYLQIVQGLDALETGVQMLPASAGLFLIATGVLGVGMGLIVSQLGNVVQSAVGDDDRSEAGGLQNTAQQIGSSLGTALLGAIVISGLITAFTANVAADPRISRGVSEQVEVRLSAGGSATRRLPTRRFDELGAGADPPPA